MNPNNNDSFPRVANVNIRRHVFKCGDVMGMPKHRKGSIYRKVVQTEPFSVAETQRRRRTSRNDEEFFTLNSFDPYSTVAVTSTMRFLKGKYIRC